MAQAIPKPCRVCNKLTINRNGYCDTHKTERTKQQDRFRGTAAERGYDSKWQKARKDYLLDNPLCVRCKAEGVIKEARVVDHIVPHKGDQKLFWSRSNWQSLCKPHHDSKTATEDSGFIKGGGGSKV